MEGFLSSVLMGSQGGGQTLIESVKIAVLPIAKVFTVCFMGFLMASKRVNILPASGRKLLNGLVFSLLLPCLIFSQLGQAVTVQKMLEWWFIPVNVVLGSISGSLIGLVVASVARPPYPFFKFTIVQIGIGKILRTCSFQSLMNIHFPGMPTIMALTFLNSPYLMSFSNLINLAWICFS